MTIRTLVAGSPFRHVSGRLFVSFLAASFILFSGAPLAFAQATEGLQVKPAIIEEKVNPGESKVFTITIKNISSDARTFTLEAADITGLNDQGLPVFARPGAQTSYSLSSWFQLPSAPITLAPGESKPVTFTVKVPVQTTPGAHFGGVFFSAPGDKTAGNGASIALKVGTIVSLQLAGQIDESARLREFSTDKLVYGSPTVDFTSKVENLGNTLLRPHGIIEITDMLGKKVATLDVNDDAAPVFPASLRAYKTEWQSDSFAIGRYQAVLSISYGDEEKKTITATTSFWVLPWKLIAIVIGGLLLVIFLIWGWVRMYLRRQLAAMGVANTKGSDMDYYARKYNSRGGRLLVILVALVLLCIVMLAALFLLFA